MLWLLAIYVKAFLGVVVVVVDDDDDDGVVVMQKKNLLFYYYIIFSNGIPREKKYLCYREICAQLRNAKNFGP
jgi:hypothetical protein